MGKYSKYVIEKICKNIEKIPDAFLLRQYIEDNIPVEVLSDKEFVDELIKANPKVKGALELINLDNSIKDVSKEIEELGLKEVIKDEKKLDKIPKKYAEELYNIAKEYEDNKEYETAKKIYRTIIDLGPGQVYKYNTRLAKKEGNTDALSKNKDVLFYKAKVSYFICKTNNNEQVTEKELEEIHTLLSEDQKEIMKPTDAFIACFSDLSIETFQNDILPKIKPRSRRTGTKHEPGSEHEPQVRGDYIEALSPDKRVTFIKENFNVLDGKVKLGNGSFKGYIVFEIKDSDVMIIEKFFDEIGTKDNKEWVATNNAATYIVHKSVDLDFRQLKVAQLSERKRENRASGGPKLIDSASHRTEKYYENLMDRFNEIEENGKKLENGYVEVADEQNEHIPVENIDNIGNIDIKEKVEEPKEKVIEIPKWKKSLDEMMRLDKEYTKLNDEIQNVQQEKDSICRKIDFINKNLAENVKKNITEEIKGLMEVAVENLQNLKDALEQIEILIEDLRAKEKENREKRDAALARFNEQKSRGEE